MLLPCRALVSRALTTPPPLPPPLSTPPQPPSWSSANFWNSYYDRKAGAASFDWFTDDAALLQRIATATSPPNSNTPLSVLHIGAGTSSLAELLHASLPPNSTLVHTDFSPTAIAALTARLDATLDATLCAKHQVVQADIRTATLAAFNQTAPFDVIVDKGTLDVFVHAHSDPCFAQTLATLHELLSPTGRYIMATNDEPELRFDMLLKHGGNLFDLSTMTIQNLSDDDVEISLLTLKPKAA